MSSKPNEMIVLEFGTRCFTFSSQLDADQAHKYAKSYAKSELEKIVGYGYWLLDRCDLHDKYTSACLGCQRAREGFRQVRYYEDIVKDSIAALDAPKEGE